MSTTESTHPRARTASPCDHRARAGGVLRPDGRFAAGDRPGPQGAAPRRAVELPGLRPASDRRASGAGVMDGGRRRQPLHRLRHGLRRALRRPLQPDRAAGDRGAARQRHVVRHAVRVQRRRRRDARRPVRARHVALHELGHRGDDGRDPRRPWRDRPREDREGRGRLPRPPRRGDDLDEAADRRRRPGRCAVGGPGDRGHHARRAATTPSSSRTTMPPRSSVCSRPATWRASSSSR